MNKNMNKNKELTYVSLVNEIKGELFERSESNGGTKLIAELANEKNYPYIDRKVADMNVNISRDIHVGSDTIISAVANARDNSTFMSSEINKDYDEAKRYIDALYDNDDIIMAKSNDGSLAAIKLLKALCILQDLFVPNKKENSNKIYEDIQSIFYNAGIENKEDINTLAEVFGRQDLDAVSIYAAALRQNIIDETAAQVATNGQSQAFNDHGVHAVIDIMTDELKRVSTDPLYHSPASLALADEVEKGVFDRVYKGGYVVNKADLNIISRNNGGSATTFVDDIYSPYSESGANISKNLKDSKTLIFDTDRGGVRAFDRDRNEIDLNNRSIRRSGGNYQDDKPKSSKGGYITNTLELINKAKGVNNKDRNNEREEEDMRRGSVRTNSRSRGWDRNEVPSRARDIARERGRERERFTEEIKLNKEDGCLYWCQVDSRGEVVDYELYNDPTRPFYDLAVDFEEVEYRDGIYEAGYDKYGNLIYEELVEDFYDDRRGDDYYDTPSSRSRAGRDSRSLRNQGSRSFGRESEGNYSDFKRNSRRMGGYESSRSLSRENSRTSRLSSRRMSDRDRYNDNDLGKNYNLRESEFTRETKMQDNWLIRR